MIFNLYKKKGETPLECIERFKNLKIERLRTLETEKACYLGRLDPLAEGVLLVVTGKDIKKKEEFLALDKDYEFSCLFGFTTDTYDLMGKILAIKKVDKLSELDLIKIAEIYEGEREQEYPFYSSKMIAARKSFHIKTPPQSLPLLKGGARNGVVLPTKKIIIHKLNFKTLNILSPKELFGRILADISRVKGNFRQTEILEGWKDKLLGGFPSPWQGGGWVGSFSASVSSGTYIRSLVNKIGATLGCGATCFSIRRTRLGDFKLENSIRF